MPPLQKHPLFKYLSFNQLTHSAPLRHLGRRSPVQRCNRRHACIRAGGYRGNLCRIPQLIEHHHLRCQTAHRLQNTDRFRISAQHVAATQSIYAAKLSALVHHRYAHVIGGKRGGDIA